MPTSLPSPILYDSLTQLEASDENVILQRLFDRDQTLLVALTELQAIEEDLFYQFGRMDGIDARIKSLNSIINTIINSFYLDIDGNGLVPDNFLYFQQLISDLKRNINAINAVSGGIINWLGVQKAVQPVADRLKQLEDLDLLIHEKLNYIYGKWDVNTEDDILSL
jgi:hypothetical protein